MRPDRHMKARLAEVNHNRAEQKAATKAAADALGLTRAQYLNRLEKLAVEEGVSKAAMVHRGDD